MRSVEDYRSLVLSSVRRTGSEGVRFDQSVGRVLAEPVVAPHDVPSFANSAMDGYAVRGEDVLAAGAVLRVVGEVAAGGAVTESVGPGEALKIMTGAPMPDGADTIVRVEDTEGREDEVTITVPVTVGTSVREPGGDVREGSTVIEAGTRLGPAHIGVMATIGMVEPVVSRRPRVVVLSTGDELAPADVADLTPGMIRDSNRPMLSALVAEAGAAVIDLGRIPDDAASLRAALGEAAVVGDLIVTSGGVSMGEYDVTKMVLQDETDVEFFPVAMKPGKPQGFGTLGGTPFFGLPGNPVSVFVSFEQFVRPAILASQGARALLRPRVGAIAGSEMRSDPAKEEFIRAELSYRDGEIVAVPTGAQGSHVLSGVARSDAFAVLGVGQEGVDRGDPIVLELFRAAENRTLDE